jgi:Ni,Fe-hydrogenase I cytochrome b subunit
MQNYRLFFWVNVACALFTLGELGYLLAHGVTNWSGIFVTAYFLFMAYVNARRIPPKTK